MDQPAERARVVLDLARSRPATLGAGRLICVDGPAGSGKTTLARELSRLDRQTRIVHMDDLYDGWDGLPRVEEQLERLLEPLGRGEPGTYRRYDWAAEAYAETVTVPPAALLVLEGVGSGSARFAPLVTVLAWVEAPPEERLRRGLERDGEDVREHWERWQRAEASMFAREATRDRADVVVDTTP